MFSNGLPRHFLFEAGAPGKGELTLTISQGSNVLAQTSQWLDVHDIRDLYEQTAVTNVIQTWPEMVQQPTNSGFQVIASPSADFAEAKELAVFVHGWRMTEWGAQSFAETMFKRLYWQGFQGKFAAARWPTRSAETELFSGMDYITYNRSEHIAFKSGTGVAAYINSLRSRFPNYTISACAHSMGGIVAMQTLKELASGSQQPLDNLILMQAAVPAHCFDPSAGSYQLFLNGEALAPTPDTYRNYAAGITNALRTGGKIVNFFNPQDLALTLWRLNQAFYSTNFLFNGLATMKPNTFLGCYTDGTNSIVQTNSWNQGYLLLCFAYGGYYPNGPTRAITNVHELMPFSARPRSEAIGSLAGVHGQILGQEFNLQTQLGFTNAPSDHSGQFNRNIQDPAISPFFFQLRTNLFPQP
jgi:pimeloyl-ACP methyl ester carboxylesterase